MSQPQNQQSSPQQQQSTPQPNQSPRAILKWLSIILFGFSLFFGIWAVLSKSNIAVSLITLVLAFVAIPLSILQINRNAFSFVSHTKKIGIQVLGVVLLVGSIGTNGYLIASQHPAVVATVPPTSLPVRPAASPTLVPTPTFAPTSVPTPVLAADGTQSFDLPLNCPSSPLGFVVATGVIKNHVTTLTITVQNPSSSRDESVSNTNTTISLQDGAHTQIPSKGSGFVGVKVPALNSVTETVYFTFVPFTKTAYELQARIYIGNGDVSCNPLPLTFQ